MEPGFVVIEKLMLRKNKVSKCFKIDIANKGDYLLKTVDNRNILPITKVYRVWSSIISRNIICFARNYTHIEIQCLNFYTDTVSYTLYSRPPQICNSQICERLKSAYYCR